MPNSTTIESPESRIDWPNKYDLFGVQVSATNCNELADIVMRAAVQRVPSVVSFHAVHAIIESVSDPRLLANVNRFDAVIADGQPVRWALNWLHDAQVKNTVQGYEVMWKLCEQAADKGVSIYLYGSAPATLAALKGNLERAFPGLVIAGVESPPFRPLTTDEDAAMVKRVNASGAGLMFIGLGCPKQDHFAGEHLERINAVQLCVGAAFDFLAGSKPLAPMWMQRAGLAWVFRLYKEPGRLWRRYLVTNSIFVRRFVSQSLGHRCLRLNPFSHAERGTPHGTAQE